MHFCIVSNYSKPHIGGIETLAFEQAEHLAQYGHSVTIVSTRTHNEPDNEVIGKVRIRRASAGNFLERWFGIPYPLTGLAFIKILQDELHQTDVCIIQSAGFLTSLIGAWVCRGKRIPYLLYQHNSFLEFTHPVLNGLQRLNDYTVSRYVLKHASLTLAISYSTQYYVEALGCNSSQVLYPGVCVERFCSSSPQVELRRRLNLPLDAWIVLTVRRLVFKNSVQTFLSVAQQFHHDSRLYFVVVGDGPERNTLEHFIKEEQITNCRLVGAVEDDLLPDYYRAADVFVLPSRTGEGLGLTVLEAMAAALPVIVTRGGGQTEVIEVGETGYLVDPLSPEQISGHLRLLLEQPHHAHAMGQAGYHAVTERFSWNTHLEKLLQLLPSDRETN